MSGEAKVPELTKLILQLQYIIRCLYLLPFLDLSSNNIQTWKFIQYF